jgi:23S rRNA pseudouridine1911/1915/1917 synthase
VAQRAELSRNQAATLIANGNVTVNGKREKASYRALPGDIVIIEPPEAVSREITGENIPLAVAYEDEFLLVVDKPAGMVVHPRLETGRAHW